MLTLPSIMGPSCEEKTPVGVVCEISDTSNMVFQHTSTKQAIIIAPTFWVLTQISPTMYFSQAGPGERRFVAYMD